MSDPNLKKKLFWRSSLPPFSPSASPPCSSTSSSTSRRRSNAFFRVVELTDDTDDPAVWGKNFPLQYDAYKRTVDQTRTRYGGSEALPHAPTQADPRSVVSRSKIEEDTRLKTMWAGYAFSVDFREERGHAYMLDDQRYTKRVLEFKQPGTCLNCHASTYTIMKKLGDGDILKGFDKLNHMPYVEATKLAKHPVSCIDCHDPKTMALRVTRPAFHRGHPQLQGFAGREGLRSEHHGVRAGDAQLRLRPVPRRVLLQGRREAADLPLEQGPEGGGHVRLLRGGQVQGLRPTRRPARPCSRRSIPSSSSGTRASTPAPAWPAPIATCLTNAKAA